MPRFDASLRPTAPQRRLIARQSHRRLVLLLVMIGVGGGALAAQLARLTVVESDELLAEAESRLYREKWSPTVRGRILDRRGRVLARDRASYDLAVEYAVLDGTWARRQAEAAAKRRHEDAWGVLRPAERERLCAAELPAFEAHVDAMLGRLADAGRVPVQTLLDRRKAIVARVESISDHVATVRERQRLAELEAAGREVTPSLAARVREDSRVAVREEHRAHPLVPDVSDDLAFDMMRASEATVGLPDRGGGEPTEVPLMPGLAVRRSADRLYPQDVQEVTIDRSSYPLPVRSDEPITLDVRSVAAHVVGWTRDRSYDTDAEARRAYLDTHPGEAARATVGLHNGATRDRGSYAPDDTVGAWGAEAAHESELRGLRGFERWRVDTDERFAVPPESGRDVRLTIDAALQARIQGVLDPRAGLTVVQDWHNNHDTPTGTTLLGAAVVLDIETSEVLAMVTSPEPDRALVSRDWQAVADDPDHPLVNRAVGAAYAPGSIAKALTLAGATTLGLHDPSERIACNGHLIEGRPDIYRCWIYREKNYFLTHSQTLEHDPDGRESLMVSCNIYYYTLGRRLGPETISDVYHMFGLGQRFGLGAGFEHAGRVGGVGDGSDLETTDAIFMAMGQGPVDWTPMHAANAYATLARAGTLLRPKLTLDGRAPEVMPGGTRLDPEGARAALDGLDAVINDREFGTAHAMHFPQGYDAIFNTPGVRVLGKTGTATVRIAIEDPATGRKHVEPRDHAWMVCLVGPDAVGLSGRRPSPRYAIAVLIEQGGSGGRVAGPIANQVIRALVSEGYL